MPRPKGGRMRKVSKKTRARRRKGMIAASSHTHSLADAMGLSAVSVGQGLKRAKLKLSKDSNA